jgi:hypothetical protein
MKERPILFSGPMVRAILDGRKTQTRRIVKLPKTNGPEPLLHHIDSLGNADFTDGSVVRAFAEAGTRLWVRETWAYNTDFPEEARRAIYRADDASKYDADRWRPSIHMPRWASRITLEVVNVRVERLQNISEEDAKVEGIMWMPGEDIDGYSAGSGFGHWNTSKDAFWDLWVSINGCESWEANPWVWCISFRKL